MGKKLGIKIKNISNLEFEITEVGEVGDYISINDVLDVDFEYIRERISGTVHEWKSKLKVEVIESEKNNWLNEYKNSQEFQNLNQEKNKYKIELENFVKNQVIEKNNWLNEFKASEEFSNLDKEKQQYKIEVETLKDKQVLEIENVIPKFKTSDDYQNLLRDRQLLEDARLNHAKDLKMTKIETENQFKDKVNILESEKLTLKNELERRKTRNIKEMGEEFETWINNRYDETFAVSQDTELTKANKIIGGNKPDFIFKVLNDNKTTIESIVIEAKTQSNTGKTKNSDHFEKLDNDRKNYNGEYSLLISELEPNDEFTIKLIPGYQNMFVVRPGYFIPFLSLVKYIALKKKSIIQAEQNIKAKEEILATFDDMKNIILQNSVKNIEKNCVDILKHSHLIGDLSKKIEDSANTLMLKHLETVKTKISEFKITKVIKAIEKLPQTN